LWLSTRKVGKRVTDNLTLPGLFATEKYKQDKVLFYLAMILEIIGFLLVSSFAGWQLIFALSVAALVVIDVFLAIGLHYKRGKICINDNWAIAAKTADQRKGYQETVQEQKGWWLAKVCLILLWVFAIVKAFAVFAMNPTTQIFGILMLLVYLFIAYVHTSHTGYYLSYFRHNSALEKERDKFLKDIIKPNVRMEDINNVARIHSLLLETNLPLSKKELVIGKDEKGIRKHEITQDEDSKWYLKTWGLLTDDDLFELISDVHNSDVKEFLAKQCLRAQLSALPAPEEI
jgi:uncharacterized membrane protein